MKKLLIALIFALASTSAFAEWIKVGEDGESSVYTDPSTIRKKGDLVKIWSLYDLKLAQNISGKMYLSMEKQFELDCVKRQIMATYILYYTEKMGGGEKGPFNYLPKQWQPVASSSAAELIWKTACSKQ